MTFGFPKSTTAARKAARTKERLKREEHEQTNKARVRRRDRGCRFPMCGCKAIKLQLVSAPEVSHQRHKGMGGNPAGDRSLSSEMIQLCRHRHQDGAVSRHRGNLVAQPTTRAGTDGPVRWLLSSDLLVSYLLPSLYGDPAEMVFTTTPDGRKWVILAEEQAVGVLVPLRPWQKEALRLLARMED